MRIVLGLLLLVAVALLAYSSLFTVDRTEYVYLTQFGRHLATYDGATAGGLHQKMPWPIQTVQRLDSRLQFFDLPETELLTHDPEGRTVDKTLTVVAYVCWRIADADAVDLFVRRLGSADRARAILGERLRGQLGAVIGQMRLDDLISTEPGHVDQNLAKLRSRLLEERESVRSEYGIDLVDVRLRRTSYPLAVRDAIFDRIRSERQKKVADYQSDGQRQAEDIRSAAERKARDLLADARAAEQRLKGEADTEADRIRNQAHSKDVEFYAFLKKLDEYQRILGDNKTMLLLSSHGDLFDVLFNPPKPRTNHRVTESTEEDTQEKDKKSKTRKEEGK